MASAGTIIGLIIGMLVLLAAGFLKYRYDQREREEEAKKAVRKQLAKQQKLQTRHKARRNEKTATQHTKKEYDSGFEGKSMPKKKALTAREKAIQKTQTKDNNQKAKSKSKPKPKSASSREKALKYTKMKNGIVEADEPIKIAPSAPILDIEGSGNADVYNEGYDDEANDLNEQPSAPPAYEAYEMEINVVPGMDEEKEVGHWLKSIHSDYFEEYYNYFVDNGFDTKRVVKTMNDEDLKEMGISKKGHLRILLEEIEKLKNADV